MDKNGDGIISKAHFTEEIVAAVTEYQLKLKKDAELVRNKSSATDLAASQGAFRSNVILPFYRQLWYCTRRVVKQKVQPRALRDPPAGSAPLLRRLHRELRV